MDGKQESLNSEQEQLDSKKKKVKKSAVMAVEPSMRG